MVKWTNQQIKAIKTLNTNILVSAAAGSGKTATLIERIINILSDEKKNVQCENLLVTTFTNAAAGEIRERIRRSLREKVQDNPSDLYIYKQYRNIDRATISTLHSFCSEVIRQNAALINIDPGFSVADKTVADKFLLQAINTVYEQNLSNKDADFNRLLETFGYGKNFNALTDLITSVLKTVKSYPDYHEWLRASAKNTLIGEDIFSSAYGKQIYDHIPEKTDICKRYIDNMQYEISDTPEGEHYKATLENDLKIIEGIEDTLKYKDWDRLKNCLDAIRFPNLPQKKKDFEEETVNAVKAYRTKLKKAVSALAALFYDYSDNIIKDCRFMQRPIKKFVETVLQADDVYSKMKVKAKLIDYADMEHMALRCLKSGAEEIYREKYKYILIDEYQDFNYIQEEIINNISRGDNVFAVGDLKQSIYRFRNAQTAIFRDKSEEYEDDPSSGTKLTLSYNFRSRNAILKYVNDIFTDIMTEQLGEVDYNEDEELKYGSKQYENETDESYRPTVIKICVDHSELETQDRLSDVEIEAYVIADEIKQLIDSKLLIYDSKLKTSRPVRLSDIVILMRAVSNYGDKYTEILNKCGISAYSEVSIEFLSNKTISDLYALLNVVDNPYQDIYLAQILKNKAYNFNECEFALIKKDKSDLYDALVSYNEEDRLQSKIQRFLEDFHDIRKFSRNNTVEKTVYYAMTKSGIYYVSREQDLLKRFYVLAVECYKKGIDDLYGFLDFLKSKDKHELSVIYDIMRQNKDNTVNIMSIHKSKGLEFPVVILAGSTRPFNFTDAQGRLIIDRKLGIGSDYINCDNKTYHKHITKNALSLSMQKQSLSEEMRVLYVALTRAKEKLIITGIDKSFDEFVIEQEAKCPFDWILPNSYSATFKTLNEKDCENIIRNLTEGEVAETVQARDLNDAAYYQNILAKTGFEYPYLEETRLNRKVTVTELSKYKSKRYDIDDFYNRYRVQTHKKPMFMQKDSKISAAQKGTIMHKIMASIDLRQLNNPEYISYIKSKITEPEYLNNILAFIGTPLFNDICEADAIYQEKVFFMPVNTSYISAYTDDKYQSEHEVLLQGVIDCLIIKDGYATIVDYKTDKVEKGNEKEHALRYMKQLDIYSEAVERIMGIKVTRKIIHFFETNTNVELNLL